LLINYLINLLTNKIMAKTNFKITNLHCGACVKISTMALKKIAGVKNVKVEENGAAEIEAEKEIAPEEIKKVLAEVDKTAVF